MTKNEALRLALEALEDACGNRCNAEYNPCFQREAITAIKAALEANEFNPDWDTQAVLVEEIQRMAKRIEELEAKDEPVAWVCEGFSSDEKHAIDYWQGDVDDLPIGTQLYTTPPQRKPLTDEQAMDAYFETPPFGTYKEAFIAGIRFIEATHGIKGEA